MPASLAVIEEALGHAFARPELLTTALTHSSWANERGDSMGHNERLEFLGDAVLELCVSEELFSRFPEAPEGELTLLRSQLVNEASLADMAHRLALEEHILLGKGEENQGGRGRPALLSDAFEAVIGALFLDGGYAAFGHVVSGMDVVDEIAAVSTDWNDKPRTPVVMEKVEII